MREADLRSEYQVGVAAPDEIARMLVTLFQELRAGLTKDKKTKLKPPSASLSTAEAIGVLFQSGILAQQFGDGEVRAKDVARSVVGALSQDGEGDRRALGEYCETVAKTRGGPWKEFAAATKDRIG